MAITAATLSSLGLDSQWDTGVYQHFTNDADLTTLIAGRLYPLGQQSVTEPYVTYSVVTAEGIVALDGTTNVTDLIVNFSTFASNPTHGRAIVEAIRRRFEGYEGYLGSTNIRAWIGGFRRGPEFFEEDTRLHHMPCDILLHYREVK